MTGWLAIAGLGPGAGAPVTPEVTAALAETGCVVGCIPCVARHPAPRRQPGGLGPGAAGGPAGFTGMAAVTRVPHSDPAPDGAARAIPALPGWLSIAGLGPGAGALVTPEVTRALAEATDVVGYIPYVARVAPRLGLTLHPSDNRVEMDRAQLALRLAAQGRRVVVVSSGDPGVFAMASAVFEALEAAPEATRALDIRVLPGITAMLAAAARAGAPLGHDFCAINLSDNLKPQALVERRLRLAVEADFAIALYNPRSATRPEGFARALALLQKACGDARPVIFARNVSLPDEVIRTVPLPECTPGMADMRTVVIVGSSRTRIIPRAGTAPFVYTPRAVPP
jgi:precorrin-3B C17-methyltransferase